jgi:hypothetical protein
MPSAVEPAGVLGAEIRVNILPVGQPLTRDGRFASNCDKVASRVKGQPTPTDPALPPLSSRERAGVRVVALDTRTPYTRDYAGAQGGKNANYLLRWVNPTGEKGPWSETATVTVGA